MRKQRRGLAAMSASKRKKIAEKGARALHESGKAHKFTSETGRKAREKQG
jgi:hypothetical protein